MLWVRLGFIAVLTVFLAGLLVVAYLWAPEPRLSPPSDPGVVTTVPAPAPPRCCS